VSEEQGKKVQIGFTGTVTYRDALQEASRLRGIEGKRGGKGKVQPFLEQAVDLFLAVSPKRYAAGDVERLKAHAAKLAGEEPPPSAITTPPTLDASPEELRLLEKVLAVYRSDDETARSVLKHLTRFPK